MKEKIPPSVWLYLSLKNKKIESKNRKSRRNRKNQREQAEHEKYGIYSDKPTEETKNVLLGLISDRIQKYQDYEKSVLDSRNSGSELVHEQSVLFLKTEQNLLENIKESLLLLKIGLNDTEYDENEEL